jgi:hypothetical protein
MPEGDKGAVMRYAVPDVPLDTQIGIASTLSALDARIAENRKINHNFLKVNNLLHYPAFEVKTSEVAAFILLGQIRVLLLFDYGSGKF